MQAGADPSAKTSVGMPAVKLASSDDIRGVLAAHDQDVVIKVRRLPITGTDVCLLLSVPSRASGLHWFMDVKLHTRSTIPFPPL